MRGDGRGSGPGSAGAGGLPWWRVGRGCSQLVDMSGSRAVAGFIALRLEEDGSRMVHVRVQLDRHAPEVGGCS